MITDRLRKFATQELPTISDDQFLFAWYGGDTDTPEYRNCIDRFPQRFKEEPECKTVGCAIGWLTKFDPRVRWTQNYGLRFKGNSATASSLMADVFGLPVEDGQVFYPNSQRSVDVRLPLLGDDATVQQVCDMLIQLCDIIDEKQVSK